MKKTALVLCLAIATTALTGHVWADPKPTKAGNTIAPVVQANQQTQDITSFLSKLQKSVKEENKKEVAKLISYPLNLINNGKKTLIYTQEQFVQKYDRIITKSVKKQLLNQKSTDLFENENGYMIGRGAMWISEINNRLRVYSINAAYNPYEVAGIDDPEEFIAYLNKLKKEVRANNKKVVAHLISYPLRVNKDGKATLIKTKKQFIAKYDQIITKQVKKKLLEQDPDNVFVRDVGVSIGEGTMWVSQFGKKIAVYAINL
ncbi:hypothetical protein NQ117_00790 [Paenibacillus sp. SC116]|nr:hypothetical protein [Paenibacillus sp. SC116]